jgi:hypothetical protein
MVRRMLRRKVMAQGDRGPVWPSIAGRFRAFAAAMIADSDGLLRGLAGSAAA